MIITAQIVSQGMNDDGTVRIHCSYGFTQAGVATNDGAFFNITLPMILTAAAMDTAVRLALSDYLNTTYSLTTLPTDVILFSGVAFI